MLKDCLISLKQQIIKHLLNILQSHLEFMLFSVFSFFSEIPMSLFSFEDLILGHNSTHWRISFLIVKNESIHIDQVLA